MVKFFLSRRILSLLFITSLFAVSCIDEKKAIYFNGVQNETIPVKTPVPEPVIQKNDILSISVSSLNPEASAVFNTANTPGNASTSASVNIPIGYLVNTEGNLQYPFLGNIKAEGLTKSQLKETITKMIVDKKLLLDPIVNIRFLNFKVTIIGEVNKPDVIAVPNEKISLLEAVGLAGDITIDAKRSNVLLIREENGEKITRRLNLNSKDFLSSPYYYLKSNDVVYVEPTKTRIANSKSNRTLQLIPIIVSVLSLAIIIATRK